MKSYLVTLAFLVSFLSTLAQPNTEHTIFLIGDGGEPDLAENNLAVLTKKLEAAGKNATLIFLGDNIYHNGLPGKEHTDRARQEQKLKKQLDITANFKGKTIVIPGNHDWDDAGSEGWEKVIYQSEYVKDYFGSEEVFFPKNGHPGPEEIKLDNGLFLILFDMQWILHKWRKPLSENELVPHEALDVLVEIGQLLEEHKNDHVIVAAHHPVYSYGLHGGKFPLKSHLFPLTELHKSLYVPLPVIGSIYPIYRSTAGSIQDIPHPKYKLIRNALESYLVKYPNVVYVAGHDHSLQHIQKDNVNYIISGTGSKTTFVKKQGKHLKFGATRVGFSTVDYNSSGNTTTEFWAADESSPSGEKIYESLLYKHRLVGKKNNSHTSYQFNDSIKTTVASSQYAGGKLKRKVMGNNYRDVWESKVEVPIFNIDEEKGGLEIIKKGGGMQTNSLRMKASDGKQYVLRSVEKYPEKALPKILQKTFAVSIVQDQISASHPYGAFVIPPMADALGIYHTNPKLVYVPDDGNLEEHRDTFANMLALYEERPAKNWSDASFFGYSENIVNTAEVIKKLKTDNDNHVDEKFVLKNRMFDMIVGDWDRHEDQWRWASFEKDNGTMYQPIPRDRDQVFFLNEGILPKIASRRWAVPKVEGFNGDVRWAPGFNFNARFFDRIFLSGLTRSDWMDVSREVQHKLTDDIIENAIQLWPDNVYAMTGESTIETLKARRDNLAVFTQELYRSLAKEVEVLCTDKKEFIHIENVNKEKLKVTVNKISKSGKIEHITYERLFLRSETREVRIYGFGNDDQFKVTGAVKSKIKVRVIGGKGKDIMVDNTELKSARNVKVYDKISSVEITKNKNSFKSRLGKTAEVNGYDPYWFKYDVLMPLAYGAFNKDDGFILGGGFIFTKHGWRKKPFASRHFFIANHSFGTDSWNIKYRGEVTDVLGKWNLDTYMDINKPFQVKNFFGLGNESTYDFENQDINYYRIGIENNHYKLALSSDLGLMKSKFSVGVQHRGVEVEEQEGNKYILSSEFDEFNYADLEKTKRYYSGVFARLVIDSRDASMLTTRGVYWDTEVSSNMGWNDYSSNYSRIESELSLFYSFQFPAIITLASRTGISHNLDKLRADEFYAYSVLGGKTNLRGFRRTRFVGQTSFYQNVDMRIKLFNFSSFLFPGKFGIHGFYDMGRVWLDFESSDTWHNSIGTGIWLAPASKAVISTSIAFSNEENLVFAHFGFFF